MVAPRPDFWINRRSKVGGQKQISPVRPDWREGRLPKLTICQGSKDATATRHTIATRYPSTLGSILLLLDSGIHTLFRRAGLRPKKSLGHRPNEEQYLSKLARTTDPKPSWPLSLDAACSEPLSNRNPKLSNGPPKICQSQQYTPP